MSNVTVNNDSRVVADTTIAAYSFSLSKVSAKIEVMAEAGSAVMIITVFIGIEENPINKATR